MYFNLWNRPHFICYFVKIAVQVFTNMDLRIGLIKAHYLYIYVILFLFMAKKIWLNVLLIPDVDFMIRLWRFGFLALINPQKSNQKSQKAAYELRSRTMCILNFTESNVPTLTSTY